MALAAAQPRKRCTLQGYDARSCDAQVLTGLDIYQFEFVSDFLHEKLPQSVNFYVKIACGSGPKTRGAQEMFRLHVICSRSRTHGTRLKLYALVKAEGKNYLCSVSARPSDQSRLKRNAQNASEFLCCRLLPCTTHALT